MSRTNPKSKEEAFSYQFEDTIHLLKTLALSDNTDAFKQTLETLKMQIKAYESPKKCKNTKVKKTTLKRCNEMIDNFEYQISQIFGKNAKYKYSKKEREALIKEIQDNPTHFWEVTLDGLIHYEISSEKTKTNQK